MMQRIREQIGSAGLVVAIVAVVLAVAGGAYAAGGGLSGKQKKEVEKISKKFAGKPGANGTPGQNGGAGKEGPQGKEGSQGKEGPQGKEGSEGKTGKSVALSPIPVLAAKCAELGGVEVMVEGQATGKEVCNGKEGLEGEKGADGNEGKPWTPEGILPEGATEFGSFAFTGTEADTAGVYVPISFPLRLPDTPSPPGEEEVHFVTQEEVAEETKPAECSGNMNFPKAAPGNLCVYESNREPGIENATFGGIVTLSNNGSIGASRTGAFLVFNMTGAGFGTGAWAVTAPVGAP
jgi:hypothetical protein